MRRSGLWIALVIFLGLAAWIRYFETRPRKAPAAPAFLAVEPTKVRAISVAWIDTTRIEKEGGEWVIVAPRRFPADPIAIEALLSRCRDLPLRRHFSIEPGAAESYGLDRPRAFVRLELTDSSAVTLLIGAPAPASPAFFVQVAGQPEVGVMADSEVDNYFRKEMNGWRRRNLFAFQEAQARGIDLAAGGPLVTLRSGPEAGTWRVEKPFPGPADPRMVTDFVKGLLAMRARSYPDDSPVDLARYGLVRPAGSIVVHLSSGGRDSLILGGLFDPPSGGRERYARTSEFPNVFGVPPGYLGVAGRGDFFFRKKRLFQAGFAAAASLTLTRGESSLSLAPDSAGTWRLPGEARRGGTPPPDRGDLVRQWVEVVADSIVPAGAWRRPGPGQGLEVRLVGGLATETLHVGRPVAVAGRGEMWPAWLILSDPPRPAEVFLLGPDLIRQTLALFPAG